MGLDQLFYLIYYFLTLDINLESPEYFAITYIKHVFEEIRRIIKSGIPEANMTFLLFSKIIQFYYVYIKDKNTKN